MSTYAVKPDEVEAKVKEWKEEYPDLVRVERLKQYGGFTLFAITVSDQNKPLNEKLGHLFHVPHAHEPAGTAAIVDYIDRLLKGDNKNLFLAIKKREQVLRKCFLTFIPDGNPQGRFRSPEKFWDGRKYTNKEFLEIAFGINENGERFPRYGYWSLKEHNPKSIGIVYEQISEHEFVEPNRDLRSSLMKMIRHLLSKQSYMQILALHQTEFEHSKYNAEVILPCIQRELPTKIQKYNIDWGKRIIKRWRDFGANPVPEPKPLGYKGEQREYFIKCWADIYRQIPTLTVEVQNNNIKTPPRTQVLLQELAIDTSVMVLLKRALTRELT